MGRFSRFFSPQCCGGPVLAMSLLCIGFGVLFLLFSAIEPGIVLILIGLLEAALCLYLGTARCDRVHQNHSIISD